MPSSRYGYVPEGDPSFNHAIGMPGGEVPPRAAQDDHEAVYPGTRRDPTRGRCAPLIPEADTGDKSSPVGLIEKLH